MTQLTAYMSEVWSSFVSIWWNCIKPSLLQRKSSISQPNLKIFEGELYLDSLIKETNHSAVFNTFNGKSNCVLKIVSFYASIVLTPLSLYSSNFQIQSTIKFLVTLRLKNVPMRFTSPNTGLTLLSGINPLPGACQQPLATNNSLERQSMQS